MPISSAAQSHTPPAGRLYERFIAGQVDAPESSSVEAITEAPQPAVGGKETVASLALPSQVTAPGLRFRDVLLADEPDGLWARSILAVLLYLAAVSGREALHLATPGPLRYLAFFPALMAAGFFCRLLPSIVLLAALAITGFFWADAYDPAPLGAKLILVLAFVFAGTAVIVPASYAIRARHHLRIRDERLALLNDELRHRIKNLFAVAHSMCIYTFQTASDEKDISRIIIDRLRAVARAQDFLSITSNEGADLRELTQAIIGPLCPDPARMELTGPAITLRPESTTSFAMVLHELATNAIKHGAWKANCEGKVAVRWRLDGAQLWFHWLECGATLVSQAKLGFGSKLIQQSLRNAKVAHVLHPDGAQCTISVTL